MFDIFHTYLPRIKQFALISACFSVIKAALIISSFIYLTSALVSIWQNQNISSCEFYQLVTFCVLFFLRFVLSSIESVFSNRYSGFSRKYLLNLLANKYYDSNVSVIKRAATSSIVIDCITGLEDAQNYIKIIIPKTCDLLVIPLVLLIFIFAYDVVSGIISLICFLVIIIFMRLIGMSAGEKSRLRFSEFLELGNNFTDSLSGIDDILNFDAEISFGRVVFGKSERLRKVTMETLKIALLSSTVLDIIATLSICAVAIMLGFRLCDMSINFYNALFCLIVLPDYYMSIRAFADDYHATLNGKTALQKVLEFLNDTYDDKSFNFLEDFEIVAESQGLIGIAGASGSGKTTCLNRIFERGVGFFKNSQIGYIPQNPHIFRDTFLNNMTFYNGNAEMSEIDEVVDLLALNELISQLEGGIDGILGDGKRVLSGGEERRVALARLFLDKRKRVWLIDEPFTGIDREECDVIKAFLEKQSEDKLIFVSTHDDAWIKDFTSVIELRQGHVVNSLGVEVKQ